MKVVLVDDDAAVRSSLKLLLTGRGHDVDLYAGGQAVLDAKLDDERSCLIVDYLMSDMDGFSLLDRLRKQGWTGPALLITGHFDVKLEDRARKAGYAAMFEKPLRNDDLFNTVTRLAATLPSPC